MKRTAERAEGNGANEGGEAEAEECDVICVCVCRLIETNRMNE